MGLLEGVIVVLQRVREAPGRPAPVPAPSAAQSTLAREARRASDLRDALAVETANEHATVLRRRLSETLAQVNDPGFWDDPEAAQRMLARTYQLQRVADRLHHLRRRAAGLAELAEQLRRARDRGRLSELRAAIEETDEQLAVLRLELAGAAAEDSQQRVALTVSPVGAGASAWAKRLLGMYRAWAQRTDREITSTHDGLHLTIHGPDTRAVER